MDYYSRVGINPLLLILTIAKFTLSKLRLSPKSAKNVSNRMIILREMVKNMLFTKSGASAGVVTLI